MPQPPALLPIQEAAALHRQGRLAEAGAIYARILKKNPRDLDALHLLGVVLWQQGDAKAGLDSITKALQLRDNFPDAHANVMQIAAQLGDLKLAEHHARKIIAYRPSVGAYDNLGRLLRTQERYDDALAAFRAAHESNPRDPEGHIVYARALRFTSDFLTMLAVAEAGLKLAPDHPTLRLLASEAHFALGQLKAGWHAYRHRFRSLENRLPPKNYAMPMWQGEDLAGRRLLIWAEQGPGDEVMYANMYADAISRAGSCYIQCSPRLAPVIRRSFPNATIFDRDLTSAELSGVDYQTPAASLGEWLRPSRESFPASSGYLKADPDMRAKLRAQYLDGQTDRLLVGIAWRSTNASNAAEKSLNVLEWGPILVVPGVTFVNLQYGDCAAELGEGSRGFGIPIIHDASIDPLKDMDAYAAQVAAMDVVVSSSNTAAHVAGALGIRTVCMLPASLDHGRRWYWFEKDGRTPWYPAHRLLIQRRPPEWLDVVRDAGLLLLEAVGMSQRIPAGPYYRKMISAFASMHRPQDAEAVCEHMARHPALAAEAYLNIAELRRKAKDADGVFAACEKAMIADPTYWPAYNLKGAVLQDLHRFDEAIGVFAQGLEHNAKSHMLHFNIAKANYHLGRYEAALLHASSALEYAPPEKDADVNAIKVNFAAVLNDTGERDRAIEMLREVIARSPDLVDAHYNLSLMLLAGEQWREGWRKYAWRLKRPGAVTRYDTFPHVKPWAGEPLAHKKILIWSEHGIGDEILASTMIPDAIAAARETVVLCSERLVPLFRRSFPSAKVDAISSPPPKCAMASDFDCQIGIWDLGNAFRTESGHFHPTSRHLVPDAQLIARLRARYTSLQPGNLVVGISWASPINQEMGWLKASRLEWWRPVLEVEGVTFVNLQYGDQRPALAQIKDQFGVEIFNDLEINPWKDMDSYAAQVGAMDLVISTSNTLVHTAGAVGTPTWVLLAKGRGLIWYWLHDRPDSIWYSSVRLVRQDTAGDWTQPIAQCARDLMRLVQEKKGSESR